MSNSAPVSGEVAIRVRYAETDQMGFLHHANYLIYFEQAHRVVARSGPDLQESRGARVFAGVDENRSTLSPTRPI